MPPSVALAITNFTREHINAILKDAEANAEDNDPRAQAKLLNLFKLAAAAVPAYSTFLDDLGVTLAKAEPTLSDVPLTTKQNYYHRFSLDERCQKGSLPSASFVHCSSGSSGEATYWARNEFDEIEIAARFEQVFRDNFSAHERTTLAVVALPLGVWVGGLFTTACTRLLSIKGYAITTVTPGNKLPDILKVVQSLGPHYDQTVLLGYPPYLKEVVDVGIDRGLEWAQFHVKMVLAGEVFSEEWRDLIAKRCGMSDILRDVVSLYGTADAGVVGNETALTVAARRWLSQHPEVARELFGRDRLPTLVQYDPFSRYLETHPEDGTLVVSAIGTPNTAAPLLRYCIGDAGGITSYHSMLSFLQQRGFHHPEGLAARQLPFVWVFGRSFWTVSIYGANVYVENIMSGLEQPELHSLVTGKFVLYVAEDGDLNKQLAVRVELARGADASEPTRELVGAVLLRELRRLNSEFANYIPVERQQLAVALHHAGDPQWFPVGVKHRYTLRALQQSALCVGGCAALGPLPAFPAGGRGAPGAPAH